MQRYDRIAGGLRLQLPQEVEWMRPARGKASSDDSQTAGKGAIDKSDQQDGYQTQAEAEEPIGFCYGRSGNGTARIVVRDRFEEQCVLRRPLLVAGGLIDVIHSSQGPAVGEGAVHVELSQELIEGNFADSIRSKASTLSYLRGVAYIVFAGSPATAINGFEISSSDPGAVPGASTKFSLCENAHTESAGGEIGSTGSVKDVLSLGMAPPLSG